MKKSVEAESVFVEMRNYKHYFLDILDITIYLSDRTEVQIDDPDNLQFPTFLLDLEHMHEDSPEYESLQKLEADFKKAVIKIIQKEGYGNVLPSQIDYEVVELIDDE